MSLGTVHMWYTYILVGKIYMHLKKVMCGYIRAVRLRREGLLGGGFLVLLPARLAPGSLRVSIIREIVPLLASVHIHK